MSLVVLQKSGLVSNGKANNVPSVCFKFLLLSRLSPESLHKIWTDRPYWECFFQKKDEYTKFCEILELREVCDVAAWIHLAGNNAAGSNINASASQNVKLCKESRVLMDTIVRCFRQLKCLRDETRTVEQSGISDVADKYRELHRAIGRLGYTVIFTKFIEWEEKFAPSIIGGRDVPQLFRDYCQEFYRKMPFGFDGAEFKNMYVEVQREFQESLTSALESCDEAVVKSFLVLYKDLAAKRLKVIHAQADLICASSPLKGVCFFIKKDLRHALEETLKSKQNTDIVGVFNYLFSHYDNGASRILLLPLCEALEKLKREIHPDYKKVVDDIISQGQRTAMVAGNLLFRLSYPHLYYSVAMDVVAPGMRQSSSDEPVNVSSTTEDALIDPTAI